MNLGVTSRAMVNPSKILSHPGSRPSHEGFADYVFSDYVADLQLHMTLQARNLVPDLSQVSDSRTTLLRQTQAMAEKQLSRHR